MYFYTFGVWVMLLLACLFIVFLDIRVAAKFRSVFKEFPYFNYVQSQALDDVSL